MDDYTRKTLASALALANASRDELADRLPADVYDNPDSAEIYAYTTGTMAVVIRQLVRMVEGQDGK